MKCKIKIISREIEGELTIHPSLKEIFPDYNNGDEKKLFPLLSVDLNTLNPELKGIAYFFEIAPGNDCFWYKINEENKVIDLDISSFEEMEEVPEKIIGKAKLTEIEFETTCVKDDRSGEYLDFEKYDYTYGDAVDLNQWSKDLSNAIKQSGLSLKYIGNLGGFPDFVQSKDFCGGTFIGEIQTFDLNGIGLHIYLFYDTYKGEVVHFIQMT